MKFYNIIYKLVIILLFINQLYKFSLTKYFNIKKIESNSKDFNSYINLNIFYSKIKIESHIKNLKLHKVYPEKIIIDVLERIPIGSLKVDKKEYFFDKDLNIFNSKNEATLPIRVEIDKIEQFSDLKFLFNFLNNKYNNYFLKIEKGSNILYLEDKKIFLNLRVLKMNLEVLTQILENSKIKDQIKEIDFRYSSNYIILR